MNINYQQYLQGNEFVAEVGEDSLLYLKLSNSEERISGIDQKKQVLDLSDYLPIV